VATTSSWKMPTPCEEGVPYENYSECKYDNALLSNEAQVGPSRRRVSGRKGQGAGLGLSEDQAAEEDDEDIGDD
jgi:hypothetical protein